MCANVVDKLLPQLVNIKTHEMLLAVGVLCKVEAACPSLQKHVASVLVAAGVALDALSASLKWSDAKSVRAQVDQSSARLMPRPRPRAWISQMVQE